MMQMNEVERLLIAIVKANGGKMKVDLRDFEDADRLGTLTCDRDDEDRVIRVALEPPQSRRYGQHEGTVEGTVEFTAFGKEFLKQFFGWSFDNGYDEARQFLSAWGPIDTPDNLKATLKKALKETHPDRGGDAEKCKRVLAAKEVLGL